MRTRLADGLRASNPLSAEIVADPYAKLTEVEAPWLPTWQVVDVQSAPTPRPQRFYVGLAEDGTAVRLTRNPEGFATMVSSAGVRVDQARTAAQVARLYLDSTRSFSQYSYRITSVQDIEWRTRLTPEQLDVRREVEQTYAGRVSGPRPRTSGDAWEMRLWVVFGSSLVEHAVSVAEDGAVTDQPTTVRDDLPTPISY